MKLPKNWISTAVLIAAVLTLTINSVGQSRVQTSAKSSSAATALLPLEEVKPGMKGVARTVFAGSEPQEFGLEILGVLAGFTGPRQSTIIARLSGPDVDKTGAV